MVPVEAGSSFGSASNLSSLPPLPFSSSSPSFPAFPALPPLPTEPFSLAVSSCHGPLPLQPGSSFQELAFQDAAAVASCHGPLAVQACSSDCHHKAAEAEFPHQASWPSSSSSSSSCSYTSASVSQSSDWALLCWVNQAKFTTSRWLESKIEDIGFCMPKRSQSFHLLTSSPKSSSSMRFRAAGASIRFCSRRHQRPVSFAAFVLLIG
mmetsp:Transcript_144347/g.462420  ORF Transcript_144347/g.462420 Transcript_144347/m.462420 type:complete len:208 (-) Transcript_144347:527-1150(-)